MILDILCTLTEIHVQLNELSFPKMPLPRLYDSRIGVNRAMAEVSEEEKYDATVAKLNSFYVILKRQILRYQGWIHGLFPDFGSKREPSKIAHVRDSIYCAAATWALSQAYKRIDNDQGRSHELAQSAVKCMRGILFCWIRQADKVEKFKSNQSPSHALHTVFDIMTGDPVYKDDEYEHLQIDAVALYLLFLVQMITSGLNIIFTTDEVNFVQNLVFYVERAYRISDYGMWERGSKYNNGSTEIHASSIGMAKAALEAINGMNMFGDQGASWSVIYIDIDAHNRNRTIFEGILPRESNSKNTDASLLPTVSWPAFSIHEDALRNRTIEKVKRKLHGKYGFKRYYRDGYKTVLEEKNRKYYKPAEIKNFDGIECDWPMFYIYLMMECMFKGDKQGAQKYYESLKPLLIDTPDGLLVPKYYYVPIENIHNERLRPGSQYRLPGKEGSEEGIFLWGQAIYIISQLLMEGLLNINELDPIRRYLPAQERPKFSTRYSSFQGKPVDLVLQVVLIAESSRLQQILATYGIQTQTPHQIEPIQIWSPKELTKVYQYLGINNKLGLTGRPNRPFGGLSTSKIYRACGKTVLCYPLLFEVSDFYLAQDMPLVVDDCKSDLSFLAKCWKLTGRPTFCMIIREDMIRGPNFHEFLNLLAQLKRGDCDGIKIRLGSLQSLICSGCIEHLDFLDVLPDAGGFQPFEEVTMGRGFCSLTDIPVLLQTDTEFNINVQEFQNKSTWDIVQALRLTDNLHAQSEMMKILLEREGPNYHFEGSTITIKLEGLTRKAGAYKNWSVVRLCSALLGKVVDSLAPSITAILVRGKQLTLGVFGHEEEVIDKPVTPNQIKNILYSKCTPYDICQAVLQQELILSIGKLITTAPDLFDGILKIRIGWFVHAMELELDMEFQGEKNIHSLSPTGIKELVYDVLTRNVLQSDTRSSLQKRQLDGALNRVPKDLYSRVWHVLEKTAGGIKVAGYHLQQQPTLSDMTIYELNFSLLVEQMLCKISNPAYRQINVETFMVISTILDRNPELTFGHAVNMDRIILDAFQEFLRELNMEKQDDMLPFYNTSPNIKNGTTSFLAKAVVRNVLDCELKVSTDEACTVS